MNISAVNSRSDPLLQYTCWTRRRTIYRLLWASPHAPWCYRAYNIYTLQGKLSAIVF